MTAEQRHILKTQIYIRKSLERVSPKMELFRDRSIGGACDDSVIIKGARGGRGAGAKTSGFISLLVQEAHHFRHRIACLREIQGTLEESVYEAIQKIVDKLNYRNWSFTSAHIDTPSGSRFIFRGLKDLRAQRNIKGLEGFTRFFVEEADPVSAESWDFLLPTLFRNEGAKLYFAYNQMTDTDPVTLKIWDVFKNDPFAMMTEMRPEGLDNPWWNSTLQMLSDKMKATDPDLWDHVYGGQPMAQLANAILSRVLVRQAMERNIKDPDGAIEVGCDPADEGDDNTEIFMRKGHKIIEHKTLKKQNGIYIANEINAMIKGDPSTPIKLDTTGIGVSTRDRLRELGLKVIPLHWGSAATKDDQYPNIASELWFDFQEVLPYIDIPDDPELMADLSKRLYSYDSKGRRVVQAKKEFKKDNGGRSPDKGDGLLLCFYQGKNVEFDSNLKEQLAKRRKR
jgi:phage terminase large subunit